MVERKNLTPDPVGDSGQSAKDASGFAASG
jgi:hypothetical protein